jgi:Tfp pilus assembly protein PilN
MTESEVRRRGPQARRVGLAIGPAGLTAVTVRRTLRGPRPGQVREYPLAGPPADGEWDELAAVIADLRRELGGRPLSLAIALLPPHAHAKVVVLPPVRAGHLGTLLGRNAHRYFAACGGAVVADARPLPLPRRAAGTPALAVCAPERTVSLALAAAARAGDTPATVTAGPVALLEAVAVLGRPGAGRTVVTTSEPGWTELIVLEDGTPLRLQPVPGSAGLADAQRADRLRAALQDPGVGPEARVLPCGNDPAAEALRSANVETAIQPPGLAELPASALAAFGAALVGERPPQLVTPWLRARRRGRHQLRTAALAAAAAAVMIGAGWVYLYGLHRELTALETGRRALAPAVEEAAAARRAMDALNDRLAALAQVQSQTGPGWTGLFAELAGLLPDSAYLLSMGGGASQIRLAGFASEAHSVVPALHASPLFSDAVLAAPIRSDGAAGRERFELSVPVRNEPAERRQPEEEQ